MKKLLTIAFALLLGTTLSFAQASSGASTDKPASADTNKKASKKKAKKAKKEKSKKGSTDAAAPEKK